MDEIGASNPNGMSLLLSLLCKSSHEDPALFRIASLGRPNRAVPARKKDMRWPWRRRQWTMEQKGQR